MLDWTSILLSLLDPWLFVYIAIGSLLGVAVGCIPGISATVGMGLLLPFSLYLPPVQGLGLLIGLYKGSGFGGSISAILLGIVGEPSAAVDVFDGYPLARKGKPKKALATALWSSVMADTIGAILLALFTVPLMTLAMSFDSRAMLGMAFFALCIAVGFAGDKVSKGIVAVSIGIIAATIGTDPTTAAPRLTFGIRELQGGLGTLAFIIGIFALPEMFQQFEEWVKDRKSVGATAAPRIKSGPDDRLTIREFFSIWKSWSIGTGAGVFVGAIPGPGATVASFLGYGIASRFSKEKFGTGAIEGLAAGEAANSSVSGGSLMPLFAFGIPGSATTAVFAGAFILHGITPGPSMMTSNPTLMYSILAMILLASFVNGLFSWLSIPIFAKASMVDGRILMPLLVALLLLSTYAFENRIFDVITVLVGGVIGYGMRKFNFPITPTLIAFITVPILEENVRRIMSISDTPIAYFGQSPLAIGFIVAGLGLAWVMKRNPINISFPGSPAAEKPVASGDA